MAKTEVTPQSGVTREILSRLVALPRDQLQKRNHRDGWSCVQIKGVTLSLGWRAGWTKGFLDWANGYPGAGKTAPHKGHSPLE